MFPQCHTHSLHHKPQLAASRLKGAVLVGSKCTYTLGFTHRYALWNLRRRPCVRITQRSREYWAHHPTSNTHHALITTIQLHPHICLPPWPIGDRQIHCYHVQITHVSSMRVILVPSCPFPDAYASPSRFDTPGRRQT